MKRVLLVALNAKYAHTCLAVRYLRESCRREGLCEPELLELTINNYLPEILGQIYERQPDIIGFACYIWNIRLIRELLPSVRKVLPGAVLICGGPEVSYETEAFLRDVPGVDYVIRGEGEEAMTALLRRLLADKPLWLDNCLLADDYLSTEKNPLLDNRLLSDKHLSAAENSRSNFVEGIRGAACMEKGSFIDNGIAEVAELAELPFAYREKEMGELRERILYYETSRGCPFSCAYCLSCVSKGVRYRPWELVRRDLAAFVRHDVRQVKFVDRTFNASREHFLPVLHFIRALPADCRTNFHFEVAVDYMDEETIRLLQEMPKGRVQLEIGIQSVNPKVLKRVQRANNWEKIAGNIHRLLQNRNMHIHTDLIIGLPGEDMASFASSFNAVYALGTHALQLGFLKFLKGTAMLRLVEKYAYQYTDTAPYEVLANACLTYGEVHWLHIFEGVFELYHNAGRCRRVCNYFIACYEAGNAFAFYQQLADFWRENKHHQQGHSVKALYEIMACFLHSAYGGVAEEGLIDSLLRFDVLLTEKGQVRPQGLSWSGDAHRQQLADFWQNKAPVNAANTIKGFRFTTWRDIRRGYHIEAFYYPVHECLTVNVGNGENIWKKMKAKGQGKWMEKTAEPLLLLFDFTGETADCQLLPAF